jgi:uncharacterized protein
MKYRCSNDIYAAPVLGNYLVYSPLRHVAALVNKAALKKIYNQFKTEKNREDIYGTFLGLFPKLSIPVTKIPVERKGPLEPAFLGIIPSRACNMSCAYCDFGSNTSSHERMPPNTAVAAVDWMAEYMQSQGQKVLEIHFFGGEPLVEEEIVDVVIHRGRMVAQEMDLIPHFEVSTNGLFNETRAQFVGDYFDTTVLSLDGFKEVHDRHRPINSNYGSFKTVIQSAKRLSRLPAELCLRCCVSQVNVTQLEDIASWFCEEFQSSSINFETLSINSDSKAAGLKPPDPYTFAKHCVRACQIIESYGIRAVYSAVSANGPRNTFCPVGRDTLIVSPNGRISSCYLPDKVWKARGMDLDVGKLSSDGNMKIDMDAIQRLRKMVMDKPRCERCFCRWTCSGGCHVKNSHPNCSERYEDFCIQTRIIMVCNLLNKLGFDDMAYDLLENQSAMTNLAVHPSDCLADMEIFNG